MNFAYADPPYEGYAHYYVDDPNHGEVNLNDLIDRMNNGFDAWALSCKSNSLRKIFALPACPDNVRVGVWVKPFCSWKPNGYPAYAWEPVIFYGGRRRDPRHNHGKDWISESMSMRKGLVGAKPIKFCYWIFEMLGCEPDDNFTDIFPGTGIVGVAWENWRATKRTHNLSMFVEGEQ